MKNLFLLPTDKPSRLLKDLVDETYQLKKEVLYGNRFELPLNISITNDEEIKEGWFFNTANGVYKPVYVKNENLKFLKELYGNPTYLQKIILTTDQDLIKDGVQAIDDEFLEWFIKNPSCEEIEVDWVDFSQSYFIKIPKEESKQETLEEDLEEIKNIRIWLKDRKQRFIKQFKNKIIMEQTAVEWLCEQYHLKQDIEIVEQAKEMEKQQIIEAYDEAEGKIIGKGEQYYNETFKNK